MPGASVWLKICKGMSPYHAARLETLRTLRRSIAAACSLSFCSLAWANRSVLMPHMDVSLSFHGTHYESLFLGFVGIVQLASLLRWYKPGQIALLILRMSATQRTF